MFGPQTMGVPGIQSPDYGAMLMSGGQAPNTQKSGMGGNMQKVLKDPKAMQMLAQMMQQKQQQGGGALSMPMQMPGLPQPMGGGQSIGALSPYARRG